MSIVSHFKYLIKQNKLLYYPIKKYNSFKKQAAIKRFHKNGYSINEDVYKAISAEYFYCCSFGTLLGIIRERGYITYDDDLDYFLKIDNDNIPVFNETMVRNGFKLVHVYKDKDIVREMGYVKKGISVDFFRLFPQDESHDRIFLFYRNRNRRYENKEVSTTTCDLESINQIEIEIINNSHFCLPANYEKVLVALYGQDWRTPKRGVKAGTIVGNRINNDDIISYMYRTL